MKFLIILILILEIYCNSKRVLNRNIIEHQEGCLNDTVLCRIIKVKHNIPESMKGHMTDQGYIYIHHEYRDLTLNPPTCLESLKCSKTVKEFDNIMKKRKEEKLKKEREEKEELYRKYCLPSDHIIKDWVIYKEDHHYFQKDIRVCGNIFIQNVNILKEIENLKHQNELLKKTLFKLQDDIIKIDKTNLQPLGETKRGLSEIARAED